MASINPKLEFYRFKLNHKDGYKTFREYYELKEEKYKEALSIYTNMLKYYPNSYEAYYNIANAFGLDADGSISFKEGYQNTLNITIDADFITFTATAISIETIFNSPAANDLGMRNKLPST